MRRIFAEKQLQSKNLSRLKILQTPISSWKYCGLLEWQQTHSDTVTFLMAEVELVIVTGLGMYEIYDKL